MVASGDNRRLVTAHHYVLAGGGIECARLLLHAQTNWPRKFGGVDGPLGRFYQGHIFGRIADIVFTDGSIGGSFDYFQDEEGFYTRRRITIDAETQRRHRLLNIAFLPDNPWFYDHRHGSGILSLIYLLLACEPIGRRLLPEAIRLQQIGPEPRRYLPHFANILADLPGTAVSAMRVVRQRFLQSTRKPGFVDNRKNRYPLYYHGEHAPNAHSRVRLSGARDALGLPRVAVDLRFADVDAHSVIQSHALLDAWLRRKAIGRLEYFDAPEERCARVLEQACDGYHQIGLTRMSLSPRQGVVDADCKVHDVDNLFVASSSVFPTSGQANPTLLAVAMAARLAEYIAARLESAAVSPRSNGREMQYGRGAPCPDGYGPAVEGLKSAMDAGLRHRGIFTPRLGEAARLPRRVGYAAATRVRTCRSRDRICGRGSRRRPSASAAGWAGTWSPRSPGRASP